MKCWRHKDYNMTIKEVKEFIANSPNKDWLQGYNLKINNPHINFSQNFEGVINIYEFISRQADGFASYKGLPGELNKIKESFINAKGNLLTLLTQGDINKSTWDSSLRRISGGNREPVFLFDSVELKFLLKIHEENPKLFAGAFEYLTGATSRPTQKDFLAGYLLAYEFESKDFSSIAERKEAEKKSILTTRADFQKKIGEAEKEVVEYLSRTNTKFNEYANQIDTTKKEKDKTFNEWFKKTTEDFSAFNISSLQKIKDLEDLYQQKLKLEAPAKYWNERAKKLRIEGTRWLIGLIICIVITVGMLVWVLNKIADGTIETIFRDTGIAIKWSIALVTLISFLAYGVRIFSKLTFSSFHLVRDAEEREQLTYVYLALQKEAKIDQTERHLIMQSLFSRADSGLLKDDASPTMPGNIIDQAFKK